MKELALRGWRAMLAPAGRWPRWIVAAACALIVGMFAFNRDMGGDPESPRGDGHYRPVLARGDGHLLYLMARSTALDGDWVFDDDLARFGDPWGAPRTKTGRKSIVHPIGPALVWTPLLWIAEGGAAVANRFGAGIPMHGYTLWHQRFVFLSSTLFACGAVLIGRRVAQKLTGGAWAPSYAAVAVLLGTSLTYYATYMPSYGHAMDAFASAAFLGYWALTVGRRDGVRWAALGSLLGMAALVRVQELGLGVVVALEVGVGIARARGPHASAHAARWLAGGAMTLAVALVVFTPQLVEWRLVFGSMTGLPQGEKYTRLAAPMLLELLFSAKNGWFSTTPIAYAAVIGLVAALRPARLVALGFVAAVVVEVYLSSTILDWWGNASFGARRLCDLTLPLVVGLSALVSRLGRWVDRRSRLPPAAWHAVLLVVLGAFVTANLALVTRLRAGASPPSELAPSCCDNVAPPLRAIASSIYGRVGNPFEFPANAIFAIRHGVGLARWDVAVGKYPLVPALDALQDDRFWKTQGAWPIGEPGMEPYLLEGWSRSELGDRPLRWTTVPAATVLVPNLMPYGQKLTLWLAPGGADHATVRWNGEVVADVALPPGWTAVRFDLPTVALHTNELTIESTPAPRRAAAEWPAPVKAVGVAVGVLELTFL